MLLIQEMEIPKIPLSKKSNLVSPKKVSPLSLVAEVVQALVLGTGDHCRKNGFNQVVVGLSGGIDSSLEEIAQRGFEPAMVEKVIRMVDRNEYKRRQSPPGIKITPRAFGKDWRLPITNRYTGKTS
jgi:NAD synthase